jgi:hypothetical protein
MAARTTNTALAAIPCPSHSRCTIPELGAVLHALDAEFRAAGLTLCRHCRVNPVHGHGRLFGRLVADVLVGIGLSVSLAERAEVVRLLAGLAVRRLALATIS